MNMRIPFYLNILAISFGFSTLSIGCNDHPIEALDQVLSAVNRVENRLPAKTKLDFLFVIDNSNSMCEEQKRLADNFKLFSDFLFDELQGAADYRIAVVSTDIGALTNPPKGNQETRGQFLYAPASPDSAQCRDANGNQSPPPTQDCDPAGPDINPIISSDYIDNLFQNEFAAETRSMMQKQELEKQFRCRATLGIGGYLYEKGLEAMRLALSCNGPNASKFSQCCINYGQPNSYYNPACVIPDGSPEPEFLRPDASLIVIFITDENDCSTPNDAPNETSRLICRSGGTIDERPQDGVPDIYADYCRGISAQECYQRECGEYTAEGPAKCREMRCDIQYTQNIECEWFRTRLTPVAEYRDFLQGLKARPLDQILVAPIVGFRAYTELGNQLRFSNGTPTSDSCNDENNPDRTSEACCPEGNCRGVRSVPPTCSFLTRGVLAYPGTRYLELADEMGDNGLGCPVGNEPIIDRVAETIMSQPNLQDSDCVNICVEDFVAPLQAIKDRVSDLLNTYCIDRLPACIVPASNINGQISPERPCAGEEFMNPSYYPVRVSKQCTSAACDEISPLTVLNSGWRLQLGVGGCAAQIFLDDVPPAGSEIFVEFLVDAGNVINDGQPANEPMNMIPAPVAGMSAPVAGMPAPAPTAGMPAPTPTP